MYGARERGRQSPGRGGGAANRNRSKSPKNKRDAGTDNVPARARAGTTVPASRNTQRFDEAFDYGEFISNWQDQIKLRHFDACERFCRSMIAKLRTSDDDPTLSREQAAINQDNRAKVHFSLAYLLKKYMSRPEDARLEYEQCLRFDPDNPGAHFNLANLFVDAFSDYKKAEQHFKLAIRLEPTFALYRMTYAEFLWQNCNRHADAREQYEEIIRLKPDDVNVRFNFGLLLRDHLQLYSLAAHQLQRATELAPNDAEAREEYRATKEMWDQMERESSQQQPTRNGRVEESSAVATVSVSTPNGAGNEEKSNDKTWQVMKMASGSWRRSAHDVLEEGVYSGHNSARNSLYGARNSTTARKSAEIARLKALLDEHNDLLDNISIREESFIDSVVENGVNGVSENAGDVLQILGKLKHILDNWPGRD